MGTRLPSTLPRPRGGGEGAARGLAGSTGNGAAPWDPEKQDANHTLPVSPGRLAGSRPQDTTPLTHRQAGRQVFDGDRHALGGHQNGHARPIMAHAPPDSASTVAGPSV